MFFFFKIEITWICLQWLFWLFNERNEKSKQKGKNSQGPTESVVTPDTQNLKL